MLPNVSGGQSPENQLFLSLHGDMIAGETILFN
jgi:hypothetical protein